MCLTVCRTGSCPIRRNCFEPFFCILSVKFNGLVGKSKFLYGFKRVIPASILACTSFDFTCSDFSVLPSRGARWGVQESFMPSFLSLLLLFLFYCVFAHRFCWVLSFVTRRCLFPAWTFWCRGYWRCILVQRGFGAVTEAYLVNKVPVETHGDTVCVRKAFLNHVLCLRKLNERVNLHKRLQYTRDPSYAWKKCIFGNRVEGQNQLDSFWLCGHVWTLRVHARRSRLCWTASTESGKTYRYSRKLWTCEVLLRVFEQVDHVLRFHSFLYYLYVKDGG